MRPCGEERREPPAFLFVERPRPRDAVVPHAEANLRLVAEVARHPQRAAGTVRVGPEELDELRPLRDAAPGTEAEPRFDVLPAARAGGHRRSLFPGTRFFDPEPAIQADLDREHLVLDP